MAVEAVADVLAVGDILHDAVLLSELLHLQSAEVLRRGGVDGVEIAVLLLELLDLLINVLQHLQGELAVLHQGFAVVELLRCV